MSPTVFLFQRFTGPTVCLMFRDAIDKAVEYKKNPTDLEDQILEELDNFHIDKDNTEDKEDDNSSKDKDKEDKI